ncbi:lytic transglycosylase [Arcobacter suis]|uniref:Membrane-bound lytic murein transglycosylase D n=1 Tax=Arcobacter suis CECT 7833 TaxID=663365 RepID=A0AAD0SRH9_9BACT|nr:transglycosylase SLT domain-containing protein [Arcobacter suis]AXX90055.1 membrane-bound lytic murein transglycosylase D [Arcobacter suis CECT 7833]RWS47187.1 lytic transglycosylase [Arcobacter suis]
MYKFFILILFLVNTLSANVSEDDLKILKDLDIESSFISEKSLLDTFDEYSSSYNISYYNNILRKSSLNAQIVKTEIKNENLPDAVFFIPLLESSFVNQTRGKNSPAGLWQIMPETAKNLRLRNDEYIDERLDLIKSTDAASSYLKKYYKKLNKWYLAILAYNSGEGNVAEGIARSALDRYLEFNPNMNDNQSIKNYKKMLSDYRITKKGFSNLYIIFDKFESSYSLEYLVKNNKQNKYLAESSITYLKKLIAFSMIDNRNLFKSIDNKSRYTLEKVKAPKGLQLKSLANAVNMDYNEFRNLNKHIKKETLPNDSKSYNIYIPQNKLELYNQRIMNIKPIKENVIDTKVVENKKTNKSNNENTKQNKVVEVKKTNKAIIHIVKKGDSLESISKKYKVDLKKLKSDNNKKSNLINIGDKIEIYK